LIAGVLIVALSVIATQAPVVAHAAAHWTAASHEHSHGEEIHLHNHDAQHDHEVRLQEDLLSVAPAKFLSQSEKRSLPISAFAAVAVRLSAGRVPGRSWSVRGPPPSLPRSFPPAYSTAPPAV